MGTEAQTSKTFQFQSEIPEGVPIRLGGNTFVDLRLSPCRVQIGSSQEIELTTPVAVIASKLSLSAPSITSLPRKATDGVRIRVFRG